MVFFLVYADVDRVPAARDVDPAIYGPAGGTGHSDLQLLHIPLLERVLAVAQFGFLEAAFAPHEHRGGAVRQDFQIAFVRHILR